MTPDQANEFYGKDAAEWLRRWDADEGVWSVEMGGLGPGYEQAIQITTAEVLRFMLGKNYDTSKWEDRDVIKAMSQEIEAAMRENKTVVNLGMSGAQYDVAVNLACYLYRKGPAVIMQEDAVQDRMIQVNKNFPQGELKP